MGPQHPSYARRVATGAVSRWGDHRRHRDRHGVPASRYREALRDTQLLPERAVHRPHRLPGGALQQPGVRRNRRAPRGLGGIGARPLRPSRNCRAKSHRQPSLLAGDPRARYWRANDALLVYARARGDSRFLRGCAGRPPDHFGVSPRRAAPRPPRRLDRCGAQLLQQLSATHRGIRNVAERQPDLARAHRRRRGNQRRRRRCARTLGANDSWLRSRLRYPQSTALRRLRPGGL